MKDAAVNIVGARLRYHVDNTAGGAAKLGRGTRCYHLKFLDGVERNVDGGTLSPELLAEKAIVVVAAVEADVVEDSSLSGKSDLIAIRSLDHANSGRES